jgi:hypothetical protein
VRGLGRRYANAEKTFGGGGDDGGIGIGHAFPDGVDGANFWRGGQRRPRAGQIFGELGDIGHSGIRRSFAAKKSHGQMIGTVVLNQGQATGAGGGHNPILRDEEVAERRSQIEGELQEIGDAIAGRLLKIV